MSSSSGHGAATLLVESEVEQLLVDRPHILLFDGVCNMCSMVVQFVMDRDPEGKFSFASLQSRAAAPLLAYFGIPRDLNTVVYLQHGQAYTHSEAILRTCAQLSGCARALSACLCVPPPLRDFGYRCVAASRYSVFGRSASCRVPSRSTRARFLDWGELTVEEPPISVATSTSSATSSSTASVVSSGSAASASLSQNRASTSSLPAEKHE
jgi:predicted DCC family thiol-disulfide oxidoreductase YuxK